MSGMIALAGYQTGEIQKFFSKIERQYPYEVLAALS